MLQVSAVAQTRKLTFSGHVEMLSCEPVLTTPCFRVTLNAVNAKGTEPVYLSLPKGKRLTSSLTIHVDHHDLTPFYASFLHSEQPHTPKRVVLILIDISGSMMNRMAEGETRFDAAKAAAAQFLQGFENGRDRVAIVPFGSHQVVPTILSAHFATSAAGAQKELDSLQTPTPRNNTGLYSAVDAGLQVLEQQIRGQTQAMGRLFVVTDGSNDVKPKHGDDPGLLTGEAGLEAVINRARADNRIKVLDIGVGDPREVDAAALKAISNDFEMVTDAERLKKVFSAGNEPPGSSEIEATFVSPLPSRAALAGRTLHFRCLLRLPSGEELESNEAQWAGPEMGMPTYEGRCNADEINALIHTPELPDSERWASVLLPVFVFAGLGGLLAILWFVIPKLIWRVGYPAHLAAEDRGRWAATMVATHPSASTPTRRPPAGFEPAGSGGKPPPRAPIEATRVLPANMTITRTRLGQGKRGRDQ